MLIPGVLNEASLFFLVLSAILRPIVLFFSLSVSPTQSEGLWGLFSGGCRAEPIQAASAAATAAAASAAAAPPAGGGRQRGKEAGEPAVGCRPLLLRGHALLAGAGQPAAETAGLQHQHVPDAAARPTGVGEQHPIVFFHGVLSYYLSVYAFLWGEKTDP